MINKKMWEEFQNSGLLWWINRILHTFGWAIVFAYNDVTDELESVYPARVKFRGFSKDAEKAGFQKISKYMEENSEELLKEANE